jgi:hypothetical protein
MSLRSSSRPLLELLRTRTVYGSRAFSASAPKIWNNLPINIINADSITYFRKRLKRFYSLPLMLTKPEAQRLCIFGLIWRYTN